MEYTRDFIHTRVNYWKQLLGPFINKPNLNFLEIGTFEGRGAIWFLDNILTNKTSKLTIIDPFIMTWEKKFPDKNPLWQDEKVVNEIRERFYRNINSYLDRVEIIEKTSFKALTELNTKHKEIYEFIYIDGSHKASDCLEDMILSLPLLKKGGIMLMDDYKWGKQLPKHFTPHPAIDAFMNIYKEEVKIIAIGNQVTLQKK